MSLSILHFDEGNIHNGPSLEFAISYAKRTTNWTKALAYLTPAILLDHMFEEGNKRTAALLIKTWSEMESHQVDDEKLLKTIKSILLNNITDIRAIERLLKNVIY